MNKRKSINFGDRIFARVTRNGNTIYNYVSERVSNMAQLISELRHAIKDVQGLVMIHIRNYHQGWGDERPLMLYAKSVGFDEFKRDEISEKSEIRTMYFPWETH